jgi:hypothetical protein
MLDVNTRNDDNFFDHTLSARGAPHRQAQISLFSDIVCIASFSDARYVLI